MTTDEQTRATYREVLAEPQFRVLFASRTLAIVADTLRIVALSVLVYAITGSPLLAAVTYGIGFAPQAVGGLLLGSLADRLRPRPLIVCGYLIELAAALALALLRLPVAAALGLVAAVACITPTFGGASSRLVAEVLTGDRYVLGRSLSSMASSAGQLVGLAFGGVAVATLGARHALLVCAACHLVAASVVRLGLPDHPALAGTGPGRPGRLAAVAGTLRATAAGNRVLLGLRETRLLLLAHWVPPALVTGAESLVVPYVARRGLPPGTVALLLGALPVGMLVGDLVVGRLLRPVTRERLVGPLIGLLGAPLLGFVLRPGLLLAIVLLGLSGVGFSYTLGLQRRFLASLPDALRGQAFTVLSTGLMTVQGLGPVAVGVLADAAGVPPAMAAAGSATLLAGLLLGRALRASRPEPGTAPGPAPRP